MSEKDQKKEDSAKTEIKKQYARLKQNEQNATETRADMERIISNPPVSNCISEWKKEIQAAKESLVNAEPKEVVKLQQSIKARTALIEDFENEGKKEVEDARNEMEEFLKGVKADNFRYALFQAIEFDDLTDDEKKARKKEKKGKAEPAKNVTPIAAVS